MKMKDIHFRVNEIEYIEKIDQLIDLHIGSSVANLSKLAFCEGLDGLVKRHIDKTQEIDLMRKLEEVEQKVVEHNTTLYRHTKENVATNYINQSIISCVLNVLIEYLRTGYIDFENLEAGAFDIASDRFLNQQKKDMKEIQ